MTELGDKVVTISEHLKLMDPEGNIGRIAEVLTRESTVLQDMPMKEGNLPTGHRQFIRSGIPIPTWRILNSGSEIGVGSTIQVEDTCGIIQQYSQIDQDIAELNGNTEAFRLSQDKAIIQGIGNAATENIWYGNQLFEPEKITGFMPRYPAGSINGDTDTSADNVIDGGGRGTDDNTSIMFVGWGDAQAHGIFPKGSKVGIQYKDKGLVSAIDAQGRLFEAYRSLYSFKIGLAVPDWRYVVRICNVKTADLSKDLSSGADLIDLFIQAAERLPTKDSKTTIYCNRTIMSWARRQINSKSNVNFSYESVGGKRMMMFDDIRISRDDHLLNTEEAVPFS